MPICIKTLTFSTTWAVYVDVDPGHFKTDTTYQTETKYLILVFNITVHKPIFGFSQFVCIWSNHFVFAYLIAERKREPFHLLPKDCHQVSCLNFPVVWTQCPDINWLNPEAESNRKSQKDIRNMRRIEAQDTSLLIYGYFITCHKLWPHEVNDYCQDFLAISGRADFVD